MGRPRKKRTGPKKPLSAYTLFVMQNRPRVSSQNPNMSFAEVASKVGLMWRELSEGKREQFRKKADQDKTRYEKEKEEWKIRASQAPPPEEERGKRKKRKGAPKNPLSAYTCFVMEMRPIVGAEHPEMTFGEVAVQVGQMWRNLDPEKRLNYTHKAEIDKQRYENEMVAWNAKLAAEAAEAAAEGKKRKKKRTGPRNPLSAYTYFVMEMRPIVSVENPEKTFGEVAAKVGQMWRELPAEKRVKYNMKAEEDKARFEREKMMLSL
mmetsp:Transcript_3840/g.4781  ORF Transcript_3840/g.4781 Transcript_3840/m.4781 type:complete len:264 (-) Transcript_3840:755-1546(-)